MLLNEIKTSDEKRIAKINRALKESCGFTINSDVKLSELQSHLKKVTDDLHNIKLNNGTARDAEYIEKLLVKEGLETLRESAMMAGPGGRAMERVVGFLEQFVRAACEVGDEYEEAVHDAMKQYRSSKYRFNDDHVEFELRKLTADCEAVEECGSGMMYEGEAKPDFLDMDKDGDKEEPMKKAIKDKEEVNEDEGGPEKILFSGRQEFMNTAPVRKMFANLGGEVSDDGEFIEIVVDIEPERAEKIGAWLEKYDRSGENYGGYIHLGDDLDETNVDRYASQDWVRGIKKDKARAAGDDELELSLAKDDDDADDYFAHMAKRGRKTEMKEGYVKQLRRLIEADTDQAESLIAAKSFSQELQDMIEKLGRLVNEDLPAVSEQMRDSHGADVATNFEDAASGTLNGIMDQLRSSKQELDNSVSAIADGGMPAVQTDMDDFEAGDDVDVDVDADVDLDLGDADDLEMGDELGGMDAAAGPEDEELGRAKKESVEALRNKIVEMQEKIARAKKRQK